MQLAEAALLHIAEEHARLEELDYTDRTDIKSADMPQRFQPAPVTQQEGQQSEPQADTAVTRLAAGSEKSSVSYEGDSSSTGDLLEHSEQHPEHDRPSGPRQRSYQRRTKWGRFTRDIDVSNLEACFHLTIEEASQTLGVGLTVLKGLCRSHGISRWPYRKVRRCKWLADKLLAGFGSKQDHATFLHLVTDLNIPPTSPLWANMGVPVQAVLQGQGAALLPPAPRPDAKVAPASGLAQMPVGSHCGAGAPLLATREAAAGQAAPQALALTQLLQKLTDMSQRTRVDAAAGGATAPNTAPSALSFAATVPAEHAAAPAASLPGSYPQPSSDRAGQTAACNMPGTAWRSASSDSCHTAVSALLAGQRDSLSPGHQALTDFATARLQHAANLLAAQQQQEAALAAPAQQQAAALDAMTKQLFGPHRSSLSAVQPHCSGPNPALMPVPDAPLPPRAPLSTAMAACQHLLQRQHDELAAQLAHTSLLLALSAPPAPSPPPPAYQRTYQAPPSPPPPAHQCTYQAPTAEDLRRDVIERLLAMQQSMYNIR